MTTFLGELETSLTHTIQTAFFLALYHRGVFQTASFAEAIQYIRAFNKAIAVNFVYRYEVNVRYTNGDEVRGALASRFEAMAMLV